MLHSNLDGEGVPEFLSLFMAAHFIQLCLPYFEVYARAQKNGTHGQSDWYQMNWAHAQTAYWHNLDLRKTMLGIEPLNQRPIK